MKYIITALDNPTLNINIRKEKIFKILCKDIQYQDGILEILEKYKRIDFLIINELLPGKYKLEELINKINKKNKYIKIIIFLENKKEELENILYAKGVYKIFYNNEIEINNIIKIIKNEKEENNFIIKEELDNIKKLLIENNIEINFNNEQKLKINNKKYFKKLIKDKIQKNIIFKSFYKIKNRKKIINGIANIISILGTGGVGKSIFSVNLANSLIKDNKKVLIIDFDILNNSLHTILDVDKYSKKIIKNRNNHNLINNKINIDNFIININNKLDIISGINLLLDNKYKISCEKIKNVIDELKNYYNYIIIDNSSECLLDYTKNIIKNSDYCIFLIEANLLEIKKSKNLLNIYNKKWKIKKEKIKILINKYNKNSIEENIIKNIFKDYCFLGKIKFDENYNLLINENYNNYFNLKKINREYKNISKKI